MIREFKFGDQTAIAEIEAECFAQPWSETAVLESIENGAFYAVAEVGGKIAGYAGLLSVLDEGYVTNIAVSASYRNKGLGSLLVGKLIAYAKEHGLRFVSLEVRESNEAARSLYRKFGFTECGKRKGFYSAPKEDAIVMIVEEI